MTIITNIKGQGRVGAPNVRVPMVFSWCSRMGFLGITTSTNKYPTVPWQYVEVEFCQLTLWLCHAPPSSAPGRRVLPSPAASAFGKAWRRRTWRQIRRVFVQACDVVGGMFWVWGSWMERYEGLRSLQKAKKMDGLKTPNTLQLSKKEGQPFRVIELEATKHVVISGEKNHRLLAAGNSWAPFNNHGNGKWPRD